jgi:hypothetical protein
MKLTRNLWIVWGLSVAVVAAAVFFAAPKTSFADSAACDQYARDYANRNHVTGANTLGGAAAGAAGGAIIGGILGGGRGAGRGAAIGAGVGAVGGAAQEAHDWNYYYNQAYGDCMRAEQ